MRLYVRLLALLAIFLTSLSANAAAILYGIRFTVEVGTVVTIDYGPTATETRRDAAGNVYFGLFGVDSEVLSSDGVGKPGDVSFFVIKIEDNIWGYNFPLDNSFRGFRGPIPEEPSCSGVRAFCLGALSPGFDVVGGEIVNLRGGVYGDGDEPFVDFSPFGEHTFSAWGSSLCCGTFSYLEGRGAMELIRIPEPTSLALLGVGLAGLAFTRRRKH
jgi:hypothetical protein